MGSAIHVGSWLAPACHFLRDNSAALSSQQVWAFSVGMPPNEEDRTNEERTMDGKIRKVLPDLRGHKLFQGSTLLSMVPVVFVTTVLVVLELVVVSQLVFLVFLLIFLLIVKWNFQ